MSSSRSRCGLACSAVTRVHDGSTTICQRTKPKPDKARSLPSVGHLLSVSSTLL